MKANCSLMRLTRLLISLSCVWILSAVAENGDNPSIFDNIRKVSAEKKLGVKLASLFVAVKHERCSQSNIWLDLFGEADNRKKDNGSVVSTKQKYRILDIGFNKGYNFAAWLSVFAPSSGIDSAGWFKALKMVPSLDMLPDLCGSCNECQVSSVLNATQTKSSSPPLVHLIGVDMNQANVKAVETVFSTLGNVLDSSFTVDLLHGVAGVPSKQATAGSNDCLPPHKTPRAFGAEEGDTSIRTVDVGELILCFGKKYRDQVLRRRLTSNDHGRESTNLRAQVQAQHNHNHNQVNELQKPPARPALLPAQMNAEQLRQYKQQQHQQHHQAEQGNPVQQQQQQQQQQSRPEEKHQPPQSPPPPPLQRVSQPERATSTHQAQRIQQGRPQRPGTPTVIVKHQTQPPEQIKSVSTKPPIPLSPEEQELACAKAAEDAALEVIDLLQISTGGDEPPILQSAFGVFEARRVRAVAFEYSSSSAWQEFTLGQMVHSLAKFDFACYFQGQGRLWSISGSSWNDKYEIRRESNVLCVLRDDPWHRAIQPIVVTVESLHT